MTIPMPFSRSIAASLLSIAGLSAGVTSSVADVVPKSALSEPSLSPDAREIAFVAGGDIWTVPASGGDARLLVSNLATESRPLYAPDGKSIAFVSNRTGNGDIYVLDLASGRLTRRTFDDGRETLNGWSRDGKWMYYSTSSGDISGMNDVWRVPAAGGQPSPVAADRYASEYWGAPAPDGKALAITARGTVAGQWWRHGHSHIDESEIWMVRDVNAPMPEYTRVGAEGNGKDTWPMWMPDGKSLYYASDRGGNENLWVHPIGGTARAVTRFTSGRVLWPSIALDGSAIVFERDYGLWRFDVAKGTAAEVPVTLRGAVAETNAERQTLAQGFGSLGLSPDTRKAAFIARGELFAVGTRDGGEATRLSETPELEDDPVWLPDSRRLVYASHRGGAWNLYVQDASTRVERALTTGTATSAGPRVSPDGRLVAYQRDAREIRIVGIDGQGDRKVVEADLDVPPFLSVADVQWSPDSRWLAYANRDARGFTNVWVVPSAGGTPRQVSFGADANAGDVHWSPDGRFLLYLSGMRTEVPRIIRVDLTPRTPRFREDQYRDLFGPTSPPPAIPNPTPTTTPATPPASPATSIARDTARRDSATAPRPSSRTNVSITFEGIRQRASVLPTQGLGVGSMAISPDGRTLAFTGSAGGQQQIYAYSLDELSRETGIRALTTSPGFKSGLQWSSESRDIWFVENGRIAALNAETRVARNVAATAEVEVNFEAEKRAVFRQAWTYLAQNFFDEGMNGADWNGLATRVEPYVEGSRTPDDLRRVLSLMIGELNASHLGIGGPSSGTVVVPVGRLGVRFDRNALERDGLLRVSEVVEQGPAAVAGLATGDRITAVNGTPMRAGLALDSVLMGKVGRQVSLDVTAAAGGTRRLLVRPVGLAAEKALLYRQWVEQRRAYVAKASGGRLGYVHMFDMTQPSLDQLYLDLDAENQGREGVVVDVRNNNGGFVNVYAIDVLSRRSYLQFTQRGSTTAPARSNLGQRMLDRPTVLVTNQHTLSDGEDFTEGYRSLGLGKVVGEPTAGWIIFTWDLTLLDGSSLRMPRTRVTDASGKDMEMKPRPVDISAVRPVGESYSERDSQLDAAVRTLLASLAKRP